MIPDLDFEPEPEPVQDDDPTMDLMKDFYLNLDDFRNPEPQTPLNLHRIYMLPAMLPRRRATAEKPGLKLRTSAALMSRRHRRKKSSRILR